LTVSDAILIPFQPRSVDLWAGVQIGALVAEARAVNDLRAYAVINAADVQGRDNDDAIAALGAIDGVETLSAVVVRRKAFPNAFTAGLAVTEQHPQDPKAVAELLSIVSTLYAQQVDNDHQDALRKAG
jgi:chromosome partitioning protein